MARVKATAFMWSLALLGALLGWTGDVLCVMAFRRGGDVFMVLLAMYFFAACAPIWYVLSSRTGGSFVQAAFFWSATSALLSLVAAAVLDKNIGTRQWIAFGLVLVGILVRK
jgi:hypothetical protein